MKRMKVLPKSIILGRLSCRCYSSKDNGYLKRRLEFLKEQNTTSAEDPLQKLSRIEDPDSVVDQHEVLTEIYVSLPQKNYEKKYGKELHYVNTNSAMNRHCKDIALSRPWTGKEDPEDANLRMLTDTIGKAKHIRNSFKVDLAFSSSSNEIAEPRSLRATRKLQMKLENAQDNIYQYRSNKEKEIEEREQSEFRTLYSEKFTPIGSFEKIRSIADQRIEEGRQRGGFEGLERLRGKPLDLPNLNQYVDRTEHYLNNMLSRQKIVPPWIESQSKVDVEIKQLRRELGAKFEEEITNSLKKHLKATASENTEENVYSILEQKFGNSDNFISKQFNDWQIRSNPNLILKINHINNNLRSYNLQAPLSAQRLYIQSEVELKRASQSIDIPKTISRALENTKKEYRDKRFSKPKGFFSLGNLFQKWR